MRLQFVQKTKSRESICFVVKCFNLPKMWNPSSFAKRRIITPVLVGFQLFVSAAFLVAQSYPLDPQSGGYDPSQSYSQQDGYAQTGSGQSTGLDALRSRCSGPDAGPECAALAGGGAS